MSGEQTTRAGLLIAFEGLDGAGKSTQIARLADSLTIEHCRMRLLKLNANRLFKAQCRRLNDHDLLGPVAAALMKAAELAGRFEVLAPALEAGEIHVWDKYIVGSIASDVARNVPPIYLDALVSSVPQPDLTIFLDVTPTEALRRKQAIGGPRVMESGLDVAFGTRQAHEKVAAGEIDGTAIAPYFVAFQTRMADAYDRYLPPGTTLRVDATRGATDIADAIWQRVKAMLPGHAASALRVSSSQAGGA